MSMISVTILTKNNQDTIEKTLESVKRFPEVILLDSGSTDETLNIAKNYSNVKIFHTPFLGFGPLHNKANDLATHDWIFSLDSDEVVSEELFQEISTLTLNPKCVYSFPFHNYFRGKLIKGCGWYPDRHIRLFSRKSASFDEAFIHEGLVNEGLKEVQCQFPVEHTSYRSISDFLTKMQIYSSLFAEQYKGRKRSSLCKAIIHGLHAFIKSYFLKRGCFSGEEGFLISLYNSQVAFYKYLKLAEINRKCS